MPDIPTEKFVGNVKFIYGLESICNDVRIFLSIKFEGKIHR